MKPCSFKVEMLNILMGGKISITHYFIGWLFSNYYPPPWIRAEFKLESIAGDKVDNFELALNKTLESFFSVRGWRAFNNNPVEMIQTALKDTLPQRYFNKQIIVNFPQFLDYLRRNAWRLGVSAIPEKK